MSEIQTLSDTEAEELIKQAVQEIEPALERIEELKDQIKDIKNELKSKGIDIKAFNLAMRRYLDKNNSLNESIEISDLYLNAMI